MAQIQFRSDDSSLWEEKFGNGSDGALTISSPTTFSPTKTACSGTVSTKSLTVSSASGFSVNDLILIHQSRNGSATSGTWQLNKILNISGVTFTLKYDLVATFDTIAQIQKLPQYSSVTINSTWTGPEWDSSTGGILAFLCNGSLGGTSGTIALSGKGYLGGTTRFTDGGDNYTSNQQGEGTTAAGVKGTAQNSGGGGGGQGHYQPAGGGGASHFTVGTAGQDVGDSTVGATGTTFGTAQLTTISFGPGGGRAGEWRYNDGVLDPTGGNGGDGGGILMAFAKDQDWSSISVTITGANGSAGTVTGSSGDTRVGAGGGGAGAGGSGLLKGQTVNLGTDKFDLRGGTGGGKQLFAGIGGNGGRGILNVDYLTSVTGSISATLYGSYNTRQDTSLTAASSSSGGAIFFGLM